MARKESPGRVIPNFAMDKPASAPMNNAEQEQLASIALLSGVPNTNRAISNFIRQIDNSQYQHLVAAAATHMNGGRG